MGRGKPPCARPCRPPPVGPVFAFRTCGRRRRSAMAAIQDIVVKRIDGSETSLAAYAGQVLLVVNVASKCGLTPTYQALEALYGAHCDQGFQVLGFPCNQFMGQEPGDEAEIASFCDTAYGIDFPMFSKVEVNGAGRHPLYD